MVMDKKFSVCMSVYQNDKPEFVRVALDSMLVFQSVKPTQIVLVQDGPVPKGLSATLQEYETNYSSVMCVTRLEKNGGLGNALRLAVDHAKYDICARMDSDDICLPYRFEKQLAYLESHPECDIVGGQMTEFIDTPDNIVGCREVPLINEDIYNYMKSRCALNHVTVMFRKEAVLKAGNYQDWFWNEDYYRASDMSGELTDAERNDLDAMCIEIMKEQKVDVTLLALRPEDYEGSSFEDTTVGRDVVACFESDNVTGHKV